MIGLRQLINSVVQRLREQEANETQPVAQDLATPRQGLPRLLSEEDERASQAEGGDMWNVMHDEDGRRERLFRLENASACFRQPRARPTPGAHIGYQIAQRSTARVYCCAGCGAWLVRPQDLLSESEQAVDMSLDDSEFTICTESADVVEKHSYEVTADGVWCYQVGGLRCRGCDAFLGVKIKSVEKKHDPRVDAETSRTMYDIFNGLFRESRGVRISSPDQRWLRAVAPPPPPCAEVGGVAATAEAAAAAAVEAAEAAAEVEAGRAGCSGRLTRSRGASAAAAEQAAAAAREAARAHSQQHAPEPGTKYGVGQLFLGIRYLRLVDARSMRPVLPLVPLLCRACDRTLSYTDQLLCTKRRWGFGAGPPENACFTNSLVRSQFEVRGEYEEHLAQGLMDMADVYCKCGKQVGYKFCHDKTPNGRNLNQVGRFGLVTSCVRRGSYQLTHVDPYNPPPPAAPPAAYPVGAA
jgi:hypothetical protein